MDPITGIEVLDWVLGFLNQYGYLLVIAFTISENLFVIGSFTPGETIVMAAAFLATPQKGELSLTWVWICSVVGTVVGSNLSYYFGRRGGRDALLRYGKRFHIHEDRIRAAEEYFERYGSKTVFLARFAAVFKNFVPVLAGASRMRLWYFEGWTILGAIVYTSLMCAVGYFVGENFDRALEIAANIGTVGILLFVAVFVVLWYTRRRVRARHIDRLSDDYTQVRDTEESLIDGEPCLSDEDPACIDAGGEDS